MEYFPAIFNHNDSDYSSSFGFVAHIICFKLWRYDRMWYITYESFGIITCTGSGGHFYELRKEFRGERLVILGDVGWVDVTMAPNLSQIQFRQFNVSCEEVIGNQREINLITVNRRSTCSVSVSFEN